MLQKGQTKKKFTQRISNVNNAQIDHAKYIDAVMPMYGNRMQ